MTDLERFVAVARFQTPDYMPIFGITSAPGMSGGCLKGTHDRLVATGMPAEVGGCFGPGAGDPDIESWYRYWGTTGPLSLGFDLARLPEGFETKTRVEGEIEIIESECGAITRQLRDGDFAYSMPAFVRYAVRDRASWEFYRERMTPREHMPPDEMESRCRPFDDRDMPLYIYAGATYGMVRNLMGPEAASIAFHDDPELVHDMMEWRQGQVRRNVLPLVERLKPEIVQLGEDLCYNHGMLLSPRHFDEFFGSFYAEVSDCTASSDVVLFVVDTDGNAMEFTGVARRHGVNAIHPFEVKAGNDLLALRSQYPDFVLFGWLEKETVNEGNEDLIEQEILGKVPSLMETGGYFPNGDHGIQPLVTYPNLCKFMTLLHEVCGNPEGEFPRM
jgi:hypothetical protein